VQVVTADGVSLAYPGTYGLHGCDPHDSGLEPSCNSTGYPVRCEHEWCYVDPAACSTEYSTTAYVARVAISGMPAAHFTIASSVAAASLAVRGRRTVCAYLLEGLQPHRGGLSQATTECYTDIADESAGVRAVTVTSRPVLDIDPTAVIAAPVDPAFDPAMSAREALRGALRARPLYEDGLMK
ncbi:hypothetical protein EMIHUDRAFT_123948, partial [Emiliania huxleyi CCMP1516]|uniref:Uncharacterized protein n=2 Tax=Emiliania huxleyi TaxID=2903 RepID=A0A0D3J9C8_EMIH1